VLRALLKYKNCFLRCPTSMVRATVYSRLGGYDQERFRNTSDLEMWLRIARHSPIAIIDEHLLRYRRGHGSSSERYHAHRTEPERFFEILDLELANSGREVVDDETLAAYEAHRAEDLLKIAVTKYVLGQAAGSRTALDAVAVRRILGSEQVPRARLLALTAIMFGLVRLPRIAPAANLLDRRIFGTPESSPGLAANSPAS
jgi:hypothetical protein